MKGEFHHRGPGTMQSLKLGYEEQKRQLFTNIASEVFLPKSPDNAIRTLMWSGSGLECHTHLSTQPAPSFTGNCAADVDSTLPKKSQMTKGIVGLQQIGSAS